MKGFKLKSIRLSALTWLILLPCLAAPALAQNFWIAAGTDTLWDNPDNWSLGVVPINGTSHPEFGWDDPDGPFYPLTPDTSDDGPLGNNNALLSAEGATITVDSTVAAAAFGVRIGFEGAANTLEVTGGTLQVGGQLPGAPEPAGWHLDVGRGTNMSADPDSVATFIQTGGEVFTNGFLIPESFVDDSFADPYDTPGVNGKVIMSGGELTARWMNVGQFTGNGEVELSGDAVINLFPNVPNNRNNGGHFEMRRNWFINGQTVATTADASLDIRDDAVINIFGNRDDFSNTPDQAEIDRMQEYVDEGWLTANNGNDAPIFTLQDCPDDGSLDHLCFGGRMITITAPEVQQAGGDFNSDGSYDCADIDALVAEIVAGTNNADFDLTGDGLVNDEDIFDAGQGWLTVGGANNPDATGGNPFLTGDANLDGSVDVSDFNLWNGNKFTNIPAWCSGDFNADGSVDVSDFNAWNSNKFQNSDIAAVPEPSTGLIWVGFLVVVWWRRSSSIC